MMRGLMPLLLAELGIVAAGVVAYVLTQQMVWIIIAIGVAVIVTGPAILIRAMQMAGEKDAEAARARKDNKDRADA